MNLECLKVLLVDDHALFRAGLRLLLATLNPVIHVLEAGTVAEALALAALHPDLRLCLLDLSLRTESGLSALARVKAAAPQIAVVVVSAADDSLTIRESLDAGAMSFIPKSVEPEVLTRALKRVLGGEPFIPESGLQHLPGEKVPALTARQLDVLLGMSRGLPTKLIAYNLKLSEYTVKEHIGAIFQALGARNRTEAVIKAGQFGLLRSLSSVQ
jgi:DNA-binding NarL/FixJ family response regulator